MRARDVLNALERVTLFRSQAADSHRRVDDIGGDLDSAISLLELRQQSREAVDGTTASVTQGAHRAVLDWSTGVIVKLAAALPKTAGPAAAAASPSAGDTGERHARNARRWLTDPRIWRAFVRALRGGSVAGDDPSTHLPQAASLGVLRAAVFAVRAAGAGAMAGVAGAGAETGGRPDLEEAGDGGRGGGGVSGGDGDVAAAAAAAAVALAAEWAFVAILTLCGGVIVTRVEAGGRGARGGTTFGGYSGGSMTTIGDAVLDELLPRRGETETRGGAPPQRKWGKGGALMRMSLDLYATFMEEIIRGHASSAYHAPPPPKPLGIEEATARGSAAASPGAALAAAARGRTGGPSLEEGMLTELLRFQVVLQTQQTSRRKVFATFCSKLMGPLFQILPSETAATATATSVAAAAAAAATIHSPLEAAAKTLVCEALFHEENLEGYREAFTAAEAAAAAASGRALGPGGVDGPATSAGGGGKKKRRRKIKDGDGGESGSGGGGGGGGGGKAPRRVCYQQQLLDEMSVLAAGSRVEPERSQLGAMAGAPLLLEGFITRLEKAQQQQGHETSDIHEAVGTAAASAVTGGKRSRSSGGGGGPSTASPASQMFRLWAVLTSTLAGSLRPPPPSPQLELQLLLVPYLRSNNSMLRLLADHDVYRINEDWGGLEFDQLRSFSASLIRLAAANATGGSAGSGGAVSDEDCAKAATATSMVLGSGEPTPGDASGNAALGRGGALVVSTAATAAAAQEFLRAFSALLELNHNILHDDLRPVLRMTFEWAAAAAATAGGSGAAATGQASPVAAPVTSARGDILGGDGEGVRVLRTLAVGLVVSLVDTYGRLRQMDHLVRALFGAIVDCPSAAAAVLRSDECTTALGRAFRRLPEGQIESMWDVFAVHLREGWSRGGGGGGNGGGGELVAREADAELFVLFVRNLHVTSSVASGVGRLCARLAEESLRSFGAPLQQAAAAAGTNPAVDGFSSPPSSSKKKKKKKKRKSGELGEPEQPDAGFGESPGGGGGGGGILLTAETMLSFRPALDVHGWLLDLDTRCRFWSAVLEAGPAPAPPAAAAAAAAGPQRDGGGGGDILVEEGEDDRGETAGASSPSAAGSPPLSLTDGGTAATTGGAALPRVLADAAAALHASRRGDSGGGDGGTIDGKPEGAGGVEDVRVRLEQTLQQVAVHRVQQIYARLNGVAALEGAAPARVVPSTTATSAVQQEEEVVMRGEDASSSATSKGSDAQDEEEARGLVAFACGLCGGGGGCGGGARGSVRWGDEDRVGGSVGGASWGMMMPYLPVWVGFATNEQVALFLEALLARCASDVLSGRGEEKSPPLRLLSDASFYEMEAVARSAPAVILARVYHAVKHATGAIDFAAGEGAGTSPPVTPALDFFAIVEAVQTLARRDPEAGKSQAGASGEERGNEDVQREREREREQSLLEASCLVVIAEGFPAGFLDDAALAGLLVAADALDAVLTRRLLASRGRGGGNGGSDGGKGSVKKTHPPPPPTTGGVDVGCVPASVTLDRPAVLAEAIASLRRLALRLGRALPPESPLLDRLPHEDALLRVVGPAAGGDGLGSGETRSLLRASAQLLPFLAERCVAKGDTRVALKAVVGLGLIPRLVDGSSSAAAEEDSGVKRRRQRGHPPLASQNGKPGKERGGQEEVEETEGSSRRLELLHGVLSGFVAGESRRLAEDAANAAAAAAEAMELDDGDDDDDDDDDDDAAGFGGGVEDGLGVTRRSPPPGPSASLDQRLVATVARLIGCLPAPPLAVTEAASKAVLPSLLLVWSDALRLSFLGADAQRLVFSDRKPGGTVRSRSRWVEDCITYLAKRAESAAAAAGAGGVVSCGDGAAAAAAAGPMPSERWACCNLIRAVCGCSHLLDPPLPRRSLRRLVEAFVVITDAAVIKGGAEGGGGDNDGGTGGGGGDYFDVDGVMQRRQRAEEDLLLHTAFCLLAQHASEAQLDEIVTTLLEILGADGAAPLVFVRSSSPRKLSGRGTAVTFVRLTTRAGRGAAFKAVVPRHALSLAAALCRQLRGAASRGGGDGFGGGWDERNRLQNATGALEALEGLLDRQPYSSVAARVVSVILGSIEPAVRAAIDATHIVDSGSGGDPSLAVRDSLGCFRACCRVLGTVLQHYARKLYSCTPPFASLCRSLLRLFFRLATAPAAPASAGGVGSGAAAASTGAAPAAVPAGAEEGHGGSTSGSRFALPAEEQAAAASVLSRVLEQFVPHKEVLKKYAAFLLLEYVSLSGRGPALEPAPRAALLSGVFAVMQACSRRELRQLHGLLGVLPGGTGQEVFRTLNEEYQREHKYMGKM